MRRENKQSSLKLCRCTYYQVVDCCGHVYDVVLLQRQQQPQRAAADVDTDIAVDYLLISSVHNFTHSRMRTHDCT
jgi:hypothetical protein